MTVQHHASVKDTHLHARETQRQRREAALERQRTSRSALFDLARPSLDEQLEELAVDEEGDEEMPGLHATGPHEPPKVDKRFRSRLKWQKRYADRLQFAESIDPLANSPEVMGLPSDLDTEWIALAVPKGKRCLLLTLSGPDSTAPNTLLLSRAKGRPLARRFTSLPAGTILDCIWSDSTLFVLDALEWRGLPISGHSAELRRFMRDAKLGELGPQPLMEGAAGERRLLVAPVPISDNPRAFLSTALRGGLDAKITVAKVQAQLRDSMEEDKPRLPVTETLAIPFEVDGVLLYNREALYESGLSCLAGWLSVEGDRLANAVAVLEQEEAAMPT